MHTLSRKLVTIVLVSLIVWGGMTLWLSPIDKIMPKAVGEGSECPLPLGVKTGYPPKITLVSEVMPNFVLSGATLEPLAGFSAFGKVRELDNNGDAIKKISHTNVLLGWKEIAPSSMVESLETTEYKTITSRSCDGSSCTLSYSLTKSADNINLARVYLIPSNRAVGEVISHIKKDYVARIDGWIVNVSTDDGLELKSPTDKDSYYFVYVCRISLF